MCARFISPLVFFLSRDDEIFEKNRGLPEEVSLLPWHPVSSLELQERFRREKQVGCGKAEPESEVR